MQLWYDDGYRNIHCCKCEVMSRSTHWHCSHDLLWYKCAIHRTDPTEHKTTRTFNKGGKRSQEDGRLLPSERPGHILKKQRVHRYANAKRKRIIQSAHPNTFSVDWTKCPKLSIKFPQLYRASMLCEGESQEDHCLYSASQDSASGATTQTVDVQPRPKVPGLGVVTAPSDPCGTVLPSKPDGSVRLVGDWSRYRALK